ncbi:MAG: hypothetical protein QW838_07570 [Candidatus Nitrosotenuis sp.]
MNQDFSLGILDFFSYLVPGVLLLLPCFFWGFPIDPKLNLTGFDKYVVLFIGGYIIGHLLTLVSSLIPKLNGLAKRLFKIRIPEDKSKLISNLQQELRATFNCEVNPRVALQLSMRIVSDYCPSTNETIARLYAMSLFSRNMIITSLIYSIFLFYLGWLITLVSVAISILFYLRYWRLQLALENAIYRSAFVYLKLQKAKTSLEK